MAGVWCYSGPFPLQTYSIVASTSPVSATEAAGILGCFGPYFSSLLAYVSFDAIKGNIKANTSLQYRRVILIHHIVTSSTVMSYMKEFNTLQSLAKKWVSAVHVLKNTYQQYWLILPVRLARNCLERTNFSLRVNPWCTTLWQIIQRLSKFSSNWKPLHVLFHYGIHVFVSESMISICM